MGAGASAVAAAAAVVVVDMLVLMAAAAVGCSLAAAVGCSPVAAAAGRSPVAVVNTPGLVVVVVDTLEQLAATWGNPDHYNTTLKRGALSQEPTKIFLYMIDKVIQHNR